MGQLFDIDKVRQAFSEELEALTGLNSVYDNVSEDSLLYLDHPNQANRQPTTPSDTVPIHFGLIWNDGQTYRDFFGKVSKRLQNQQFSDTVTPSPGGLSEIYFDDVLLELNQKIDITINSKLLEILVSVYVEHLNNGANGHRNFDDDKPAMNAAVRKVILNSVINRLVPIFFSDITNIIITQKISLSFATAKTNKDAIQMIVDLVIKPNL